MVTVLHNQSFMDLSLENNGTIEASVVWALENEMSVTDPLSGGMELEVPFFEGTRKETVNYYRANRIQPATALTDADTDIVENTVDDECDLCKCFI